MRRFLGLVLFWVFDLFFRLFEVINKFIKIFRVFIGVMVEK
jgi:hypothetical protein